MKELEAEEDTDYCKCGHKRIKHYLKHNEKNGRNGGCRICFCQMFRLKQ